VIPESILMAMILEAAKVKAAININHFAGAEGKEVLRDGSDCFGDVVRFAPTGNRCETVCDEGIVFLFYASGHICGDDAGTNFVDVDAIGGEARGEEGGDHGKSGFGDAIIAAIDRSGVGADGADRNDFGAITWAMLFAGIQHVIGGGLREEERASEINGEQFIEAVRSGLKNIEPVTRGDARVIHEKVDPAEFLGDEGKKSFMSG